MASRKRRPLTSESFSTDGEQDLGQELQIEQEETNLPIEQEFLLDNLEPEEVRVEEKSPEPVVVEEIPTPVAKAPQTNRQNRPTLYPKRVETPSKKRNTPRFS